MAAGAREGSNRYIARVGMDVRVDERMFWMSLMHKVPLTFFSLLMYPRLYALHRIGSTRVRVRNTSRSR